MTDDYKKCEICPFRCHVDRTNSLGRCGSGSEMRVARIAPHYWEEPCLSGQGIEEPIKGSGTVFFTGCSLHCVFCQNSKISCKGNTLGKLFTPSELADEFLKLQEIGVHNVNLVTATHFAPSVAKSIEIAKSRGLSIPTVYNCSGYETSETLKMLDGLIDIYMPDFKYFSQRLSELYSKASDYPEVCKSAIKIMQAQTGSPLFDKNGFMLKGTLIRHLILPGSDADSRKIVSYLHESYGSDGVALSLMNQYTPMPDLPFPELTEKLPTSAYLRVVSHAQSLGFKYLYTQDGDSASESFIPEFK